jgi:hypothetical protein
MGTLILATFGDWKTFFQNLTSSMIEAVSTSETSLSVYQTARHNIPEGCNFHILNCTEREADQHLEVTTSETHETLHPSPSCLNSKLLKHRGVFVNSSRITSSNQNLSKFLFLVNCWFGQPCSPHCWQNSPVFYKNFIKFHFTEYLTINLCIFKSTTVLFQET